jgi:hypothetical protein
MPSLKKFALPAIVLAAAGAAHADVSLLDASMYASIVAGGNNASVGAVTFTSAATPARPADFTTKTLYGQSGLGVTGGRTGDEIDIDETVTMSWAGAAAIKSFSVSVLFNGSEYSDWAEIAQVTAYNGAVLVGTGRLQVDATADNLASFSGTGFGSVGNLSLADSTHGGAWLVSNPFGNTAITRLEFTAVTSDLCGYRECSNQSDFTLSTVTAVPEPETVALMLAGLGVVGFVARRRRVVRD